MTSSDVGTLDVDGSDGADVISLDVGTVDVDDTVASATSDSGVALPHADASKATTTKAEDDRM